MASSDETMDGVAEYYEHALEGHVFIRETVNGFLDVLERRVQCVSGSPKILQLGSHAGILTRWILERCPGVSIVVSDDDDELVAMSRERLTSERVSYHAGPLSALEDEVDVVLSLARHHHLSHDYLLHLPKVMRADSVYVLADELCPEYCEGEHRERIEQAEVIGVVGGYVLTTRAEVQAFNERGTIPPAAVAQEQLRRRALWRWYRYVVDEAVERGYFDIAVGELQSTHDDLITGSQAEHKFSALIVERQFALAGFKQRSKLSIGPPDDRARQSMFIYEFARP